MAEQTPAKAEKPKQVIYYTYDTDGRIRDTVCLRQIDVPKEEYGAPMKFYAKGVAHLSNSDYAKEMFNTKTGIAIATQRAEKVVEWFKSVENIGTYFSKHGNRKHFGAGSGKVAIRADRMQLLKEEELTPQDKSELEKILGAEKAQTPAELVQNYSPRLPESAVFAGAAPPAEEQQDQSMR